MENGDFFTDYDNQYTLSSEVNFLFPEPTQSFKLNINPGYIYIYIYSEEFVDENGILRPWNEPEPLPPINMESGGVAEEYLGDDLFNPYIPELLEGLEGPREVQGEEGEGNLLESLSEIPRIRMPNICVKLSEETIKEFGELIPFETEEGEMKNIEEVERQNELGIISKYAQGISFPFTNNHITRGIGDGWLSPYLSLFSNLFIISTLRIGSHTFKYRDMETMCQGDDPGFWVSEEPLSQFGFDFSSTHFLDGERFAMEQAIAGVDIIITYKRVGDSQTRESIDYRGIEFEPLSASEIENNQSINEEASTTHSKEESLIEETYNTLQDNIYLSEHTVNGNTPHLPSLHSNSLLLKKRKSKDMDSGERKHIKQKGKGNTPNININININIKQKKKIAKIQNLSSIKIKKRKYDVPESLDFVQELKKSSQPAIENFTKLLQIISLNSKIECTDSCILNSLAGFTGDPVNTDTFEFKKAPNALIVNVKEVKSPKEVPHKIKIPSKYISNERIYVDTTTKERESPSWKYSLITYILLKGGTQGQELKAFYCKESKWYSIVLDQLEIIKKPKRIALFAELSKIASSENIDSDSNDTPNISIGGWRAGFAIYVKEKTEWKPNEDKRLSELCTSDELQKQRLRNNSSQIKSKIRLNWKKIASVMATKDESECKSHWEKIKNKTNLKESKSTTTNIAKKQPYLEQVFYFLTSISKRRDAGGEDLEELSSLWEGGGNLILDKLFKLIKKEAKITDTNNNSAKSILNWSPTMHQELLSELPSLSLEELAIKFNKNPRELKSHLHKCGNKSLIRNDWSIDKLKGAFKFLHKLYTKIVKYNSKENNLSGNTAQGVREENFDRGNVLRDYIWKLLIFIDRKVLLLEKQKVI